MRRTDTIVSADQRIILLVKAYAEARDISISTASRLLTGSGDVLDRMVRDGMSLTARRSEKIIRQASDLWPKHAEWPSDIPRPAPTAAPGEREEAA